MELAIVSLLMAVKTAGIAGILIGVIILLSKIRFVPGWIEFHGNVEDTALGVGISTFIWIPFAWFIFYTWAQTAQIEQHQRHAEITFANACRDNNGVPTRDFTNPQILVCRLGGVDKPLGNQ